MKIVLKIKFPDNAVYFEDNYYSQEIFLDRTLLNNFRNEKYSEIRDIMESYWISNDISKISKIDNFLPKIKPIIYDTNISYGDSLYYKWQRKNYINFCNYLFNDLEILNNQSKVNLLNNYFNKNILFGKDYIRQNSFRIIKPSSEPEKDFYKDISSTFNTSFLNSLKTVKSCLKVLDEGGNLDIFSYIGITALLTHMSYHIIQYFEKSSSTFNIESEIYNDLNLDKEFIEVINRINLDYKYVFDLNPSNIKIRNSVFGTESKYVYLGKEFKEEPTKEEKEECLNEVAKYLKKIYSYLPKTGFVSKKYYDKRKNDINKIIIDILLLNIFNEDIFLDRKLLVPNNMFYINNNRQHLTTSLAIENVYLATKLESLKLNSDLEDKRKSNSYRFFSKDIIRSITNFMSIKEYIKVFNKNTLYNFTILSLKFLSKSNNPFNFFKKSQLNYSVILLNKIISKKGLYENFDLKLKEDFSDLNQNIVYKIYHDNYLYKIILESFPERKDEILNYLKDLIQLTPSDLSLSDKKLFTNELIERNVTLGCKDFLLLYLNHGIITEKEFNKILKLLNINETME